MAHIHIVGLDHFLQNIDIKCLTQQGIAEEQRQKRELANLLRDIIREQRVQLVAEEGKLDGRGLGYVLAAEFGVEHIDITMPIKERESQGIQKNYFWRKDTLAIAYTAFEQHMFDSVKKHKGEPVLVMCGRRHLKGMIKLFEAVGDKVAAYDLNSYGWYLGVPQEGPNGLEGYYREP